MKKVYAKEFMGPNKEGMLGRWMDIVEEYMCERGFTRGRRLEQAVKKSLD